MSVRRFLCIALLINLGACQPRNQSPLEDYLAKLNRVLDSQSDLVQSQIPPFPPARELTYEPSVSTLSVREFLSLRQCQLHSALAKKNSLLGKLAQPSQRLIADLKVLQLGPACVRQLRSNQQNQLAAKLTAALAEKAENIGFSLWQALLGENENRQFWRARPNASTSPDHINSEAVHAIEHLQLFAQRVLKGDYALSGHEAAALESSLARLKEGEGGILLQQLLALSDGLDAANRAIEHRLENPLCLDASATQTPPDRARYFSNVVNQVFVSNLQTHAVALVQKYRQIMPKYLELEAGLLEAAPLAYQQWMTARHTLFSKALAAPKNHVAAIQALYSQCGLLPG